MIFWKNKDYEKDWRYSSGYKLRIVDSIDGVWIEKGYWDYDGACGHDPYEQRWGYAWSCVDFYGRISPKPYVYKSKKQAKKRIKKTDRFNLVKKTTYTEIGW